MATWHARFGQISYQIALLARSILNMGVSSGRQSGSEAGSNLAVNPESNLEGDGCLAGGVEPKLRGRAWRLALREGPSGPSGPSV